MFDGVADALRVPNTDIRLFGKPESFVKRRMGVALAFHADVEAARVNAKKAAGMDGEAARGIVADFLSGMPHMKFGDFRNERTTGLGHLQSLVDDRFGAVRLGLLRGHESSSHRRDQA